MHGKKVQGYAALRNDMQSLAIDVPAFRFGYEFAQSDPVDIITIVLLTC